MAKSRIRIDEICWSLATGNTDINLGFETILRLLEKILKNMPLCRKQVGKRKRKNVGSQGE